MVDWITESPHHHLSPPRSQLQSQHRFVSRLFPVCTVLNPSSVIPTCTSPISLFSISSTFLCIHPASQPPGCSPFPPTQQRTGEKGLQAGRRPYSLHRPPLSFLRLIRGRLCLASLFSVHLLQQGNLSSSGSKSHSQCLGLGWLWETTLQGWPRGRLSFVPSCWQ